MPALKLMAWKRVGRLRAGVAQPLTGAAGESWRRGRPLQPTSRRPETTSQPYSASHFAQRPVGP